MTPPCLRISRDCRPDWDSCTVSTQSGCTLTPHRRTPGAARRLVRVSPCRHAVLSGSAVNRTLRVKCPNGPQGAKSPFPKGPQVPKEPPRVFCLFLSNNDVTMQGRRLGGGVCWVRSHPPPPLGHRRSA